MTSPVDDRAPPEVIVTEPPTAPWQKAPKPRFWVTVTVTGRGGGSCAAASCKKKNRKITGIEINTGFSVWGKICLKYFIYYL
jgi:hypothetical protein